MERLTGRRDGRTYIVGCPDFALPKIVGLIIQQTVDRLAAIEDILGDEYDLSVIVRVVRCKDCRYYQDAKTNLKGFLICPASGMEITETDYCSYGALVDGKKTPSCHDGVCEIPGVE